MENRAPRRAYKGKTAIDYNLRRFSGAGGQYVNRRELDTVIQMLPDPSQAVLDVPTGTGRVSIELMKRGYQVTSLDLSPDMLEIVRRSSADAVRLILADAHSLPLVADSFDAIICLRYLHFYSPERRPQAECLIQELARIVKPGGTVIIDSNRWSPRHIRIGGKQLSSVFFHPDAEMAELLTLAGLHVIHQEAMFFVAPLFYRHLPNLGIKLLHKLETALPVNWRVRVFWQCRK
jgi:ubiquinone/menaquinone biosynthesis C-methylase UbiE